MVLTDRVKKLLATSEAVMSRTDDELKSLISDDGLTFNHGYTIRTENYAKGPASEYGLLFVVIGDQEYLMGRGLCGLQRGDDTLADDVTALQHKLSSYELVGPRLPLSSLLDSDSAKDEVNRPLYNLPITGEIHDEELAEFKSEYDPPLTDGHIY